MSVLSRARSLTRTPVVPAPRPAAHDGGLAPLPSPQTAVPPDRSSRRRRAALVLVALVAAIAAAVTTAVVQLTDDPAPLGNSTRLSGTTELDTIRDEMLLRHSINADAERAAGAQLGAVVSAP